MGCEDSLEEKEKEILLQQQKTKNKKHIFGCLGSVLSCKNEYIIFKETLTNTTVKKLMVKESLALKSVIINI